MASAGELGGPWFAGGRPVILTGGRGFLGSHLAFRLADAAPPGAEVVCVDNGTRDCFSALPRPTPACIRFVSGDVRRPHEWLPAIGRPSVVVHLAALAGVSTYYRAPAEVLAVNGLGTAALLDLLCAEGGALRPDLFVNASTSEVYGPAAAGADESAPTPVGPVSDPRWTYAASKVFAEHWLFAVGRTTGLPFVSLRPFNVFGPGQLGEGAVRNFCARAVRDEALCVTGDGSPTRSWLYVDDFVEAVIALGACEDAWGATYNVGHSEPRVSTRALAERVIALAQRGRIEFVPHPGSDVLDRWPQTGRLRERTGWTPQVALDEGLRRTLEFWRQRDWETTP